MNKLTFKNNLYNILIMKYNTLYNLIPFIPIIGIPLTFLFIHKIEMFVEIGIDDRIGNKVLVGIWQIFMFFYMILI